MVRTLIAGGKVVTEEGIREIDILVDGPTILEMGRDIRGSDDRTIDAWTTIDLSLWLDLSELGIAGSAAPTVFVHARNLGDTEYETWGYYYDENYYTTGPGRNFAAGVSADF